MCGGGFVSGGFCVLFVGAWFCAWSISTTTTCGSNGGFYFGGFFFGGFSREASFPFVWSVALVFVSLGVGGIFGTGSPLSAIWYLLT